MHPITLMIITVLANAIVTGIIVYRIQKKIEISYAKQLEEFRASLQYSNFEHQTKFLRSYEKRIETLESLFQKFNIFAVSFREMIQKPERENLIEKSNDAMTKIFDFWHYFVLNRLFLPDDFIGEISSIFEKSVFLLGTATAFLTESLAIPDNLPAMRQWEDALEKKLGFRAGWVNIKRPYSSIYEFLGALNKQNMRLENLYKSVADTPNKQNVE